MQIVKEEAEWLKLREQYITASQAAVLVGCDPYSSPASLKKTDTFTGNAYTDVGHMLEPVVVNVVNKILGTEFKLFEQAYGGKVFYSKGNLGATPDAFENDNLSIENSVLLECKTTRPHTFYKYSGYPPLTYLIQTQVQMHCSGYREALLAIMSTDLTQENHEIKWPIVIYKVLKNETICSILEEEAERYRRLTEACSSEGGKQKLFRVGSVVKKKVKLLLSMCYERII